LRSVAGLLIVENPDRASAVLIIDGDKRFDVAEELHAGGAASILLYRRRPGRLEKMGIIPRAEDTIRRELMKRHIPASDIALLADEPVSRSRIPAAIGDWLRQHPGESVAVVCDRFASRSWKMRIDRGVGGAFQERVAVVPASRRQFDETDWWHSKAGALAVIDGWLCLAFNMACRDQPSEWRECSESDFRVAFAGKSGE
jgi:hypothetical protein